MGKYIATSSKGDLYIVMLQLEGLRFISSPPSLQKKLFGLKSSLKKNQQLRGWKSRVTAPIMGFSHLGSSQKSSLRRSNGLGDLEWVDITIMEWQRRPSRMSPG